MVGVRHFCFDCCIRCLHRRACSKSSWQPGPKRVLCMKLVERYVCMSCVVYVGPSRLGVFILPPCSRFCVQCRPAASHSSEVKIILYGMFVCFEYCCAAWRSYGLHPLDTRETYLSGPTPCGTCFLASPSTNPRGGNIRNMYAGHIRPNCVVSFLDARCRPLNRYPGLL